MAESSSAWMILLLVPMLIFLVVAGRSVAKACRSFKKPGLGQNVRKVVLRRQIVFVTVGLLCNFPVVLSQGFGMLGSRYVEKDLASISEAYVKDPEVGVREAFNFINTRIFQPL